MGCFDTLTVPCQCGGKIDFQTKAGKCLLRVYTLHDVPDALIEDMMGDEAYCDKCHRKYVVKPLPKALVEPVPDEPHEANFYSGERDEDGY